jgi:hypothetical protein|tara:strand:- start:833 stop:1741 length:909 start_codon:yes stop_codon:yes gene_type:complete
MSELIQEENLQESTDAVEEIEVIEEEQNTEETEAVENTNSEANQTEQVEEAKADSDDELENYSDNVQKRINNLTRKLREAERGRDSALNYANSMKSEYEALKGKSEKINQDYYAEAETRLESQKQQATRVLAEAQEAQDYDKAAKATSLLSTIAVEENRIKMAKEAPTNETVIPQENIQQQTPQPDPKAEAWADKNEWFGEDRIRTLAAFTIHDDLVKEGFDGQTDEYYNELDNRLRSKFPNDFGVETETVPAPQATQRVASAARADSQGSNKKQVRLSPSEVEMAKKLNVPLKEYAKFVKR